MKRFNLQEQYEKSFLIEPMEECLPALSVLAHNHYLQEAITLLEKWNSNSSYLLDVVKEYKEMIRRSGGTVRETTPQKSGLFDARGNAI